MCDQNDSYLSWWVANGEEIDGLSGCNEAVELVIMVLLANGKKYCYFVRLPGS